MFTEITGVQLSSDIHRLSIDDSWLDDNTWELVYVRMPKATLASIIAHRGFQRVDLASRANIAYLSDPAVTSFGNNPELFLCKTNFGMTTMLVTNAQHAEAFFRMDDMKKYNGNIRAAASR